MYLKIDGLIYALSPAILFPCSGLLTAGLILISLTVMIVIVIWCNSFIQLVVIGLAHTQVSGYTKQPIVNILCASKQKLSLLCKMLNLLSLFVCFYLH